MPRLIQTGKTNRICATGGTFVWLDGKERDAQLFVIGAITHNNH